MDGYLWQSKKVWFAAALGMLSFAGTFPVIRGSLPYFSPAELGSGRVVLAGGIALVVLVLTPRSRPSLRDWKFLAVASLGMGVGFPILSALALTELAAASAAVLGGILPLITALAAMLIAGERPGRRFWLGSSAGCCTVVTFALLDFGWQWRSGNTLFFSALICAAIGYSAAGKLSQTMPAWRVTCWVAALAGPINVLFLFCWEDDAAGRVMPGILPWLGLLYLAVFSQLLGFICWNFAMARAGIARIGQLQLLQPFITMIIAGMWLGEPISIATLVTAFIVVLTLVWTRRTSAIQS